MKLTRVAASLLLAIMPATVLAEDKPKDDNTITTALDEITVTATRTAKTALDSSQAINVITSEEIERKQANTMFEVLDMVPNVTATGGPFVTGGKFGIRGFDDAEDVMVSVDGAVQTFEKYRMGSFFGDPELFKTVSIKRGPSTVLHGAGALGGVVQVELKDAGDFLDKDEQAGAKVKLGYHSNNEQENGTVFAYARPLDSIDLLAAYIKRDSKDFELSNGETLDNSAVKNDSWLLKGEFYPSDDQAISLSYTKLDDAQRTEFNTTDEGAWGTVYREVTQDVANLSYELSPEDSDYIDLRASLGYTQSHVSESDGSGFLKDFIGIESRYEYNILTLDLVNHSQLGSHLLTYGVQYTDQERIGEKTALPCLSYDPMTGRCTEYGSAPVTSEISSQPGGDQRRLGIYLQDEFNWHQWTLIAGVRYERYESEPTDAFAAKFPDLDTKIDHDQFVPAVSLSYQVTDYLKLFGNYQQGFRAPLLDELYDEYQGRVPSLSLDVENSSNTEFGAASSFDNIWADRDALNARLIYFDTRITDEIVSNTGADNPSPGQRYANLGENDRDGIEFELNYRTPDYFVDLSYSTIDGEDEAGEPLWFLPADKLAVSLGTNLFDGQVRLSTQVLFVDDRQVQVYDPASRRYVEQTHENYTLVGLYANWDVTDWLAVNVAVDNLFDEEYQVLAGTGGGLGNYGLGRNIKTELAFTF